MSVRRELTTGGRKMADIKLFVCCHQPADVPEHPLLVPLQVGAALADTHFSGFAYDDTGDNISDKNRSYCELTAQYWAWKNVEAEYYGFFHYRRYLYPDIKEKLPYRIEQKASVSLLDKLGYGVLDELIEKYDLIIPIGENMYISVREHYAGAPFHHRKDLDLIEQIVRERHPEMTEAMEAYLSGTVCYFGNIYIMHRRLFHDYCSWLFPILKEFDRRADTTGYAPQEQRVDGYLAERLLGIYAEYCKGLRTLELPRIFFVENQMERWQKRCAGLVLPPGSKRRAMVKSWMKRTDQRHYG